MSRLALLGIFLLACGDSSSEAVDAGNGFDAGNLVCSAEESQVFCRDVKPEEIGGPQCCGDHGAFGCLAASGEVRCPADLIPASECARRTSDAGLVLCR